MELLICLPLKLGIITFLAMSALPITVCQIDNKPVQAQQLATFGNDNVDSDIRNNVVGDGGDMEEMDDTPVVLAGPTEYPIDFGGSRNNKQMSFGQAIILAREEARCLRAFGSQKNKTVSMDIPGGGLVIPYGCYRSQMSAQCEQCKNLTTQPIVREEECLHICDFQDESCTMECIKLYSVLKNESTFYEFAHSSRRNAEGSFEEDFDVVHNFTRNELSSETSNITSYQGNIEIPHEFLRSMSGHKRETRLIQSPNVFCEGVNDIDDKKGHKNFAATLEASSQLHFVLLKWNINPDIGITKEIHKRDSSPVTGRKIDSISGDPLVFVIEQKINNSSYWKTIGKTPFGLQTINVSYHSNTYKWRITAVGPNGIEDIAITNDYTTLDGYRNPGPPKKIYVVDTKIKNSSVNVLIGWEPPDERACFYKIVLEGSTGGKTETVRIKDQPLGVHMYWFEDLKFGMVYHVRVTSRDSSWLYESNLTKLEFTTPTCLKSFNYSFDKCAPPSPRDIKSEIETVRGQEQFTDLPQIQVTLSWLPPLHASEQNTILKYVVEISIFSLNRPSVSKLNFTGVLFDTRLELPKNYTVSGNTTKITLKNFKPDTEYTVMITAFSIVGRSPTARLHFNTRMAVKPQLPLPPESVENWIYVAVTFTVVAVLLLFCNIVRIFIHKRNVKNARNQYFQSMEERDEMGADWSIVPLTDDPSNWKLFDENFPKEKWEISWDHLTMGEVIGQGAFGVVRRAKIHKKKLEAKLKFRGDDETWFNSADRNVDDDPDMETVAVKMVKVSSTRDDREQLIKEITMMQNLGFHSQIVGLLGACTKGRTLCLVLEYCPGGDLLTFVRKVRAKYWPTLGLSGSRTQNSPCIIGSRNTKSFACGGMQLCSEQTNSGSGGGQKSSISSTCENTKSGDSSPINYADIGGFSETCSSPETSLPGFQEPGNSKGDFTGNNSTRENSLPPLLTSENKDDDDDEDFRPIDERDVLSYARQIAMGMEYLEKNRVVHRDLACRNVLLMGDYKHVKISDFGLSRDIYTWNVYHQKSNGKLPIKWMAIESIFTHVFTTKSDVWSYGILLWELLTLGGTPYPGLGNTELFHLLKSGYRMERPDNCSEELYAVMKKCWRTAAASRPSFSELRRHVETMMEAAEPNLYLSLMADLPADYFQLSSRSDIPIAGKDSSPPIRDSPSTSVFSSKRNSGSSSNRNSTFTSNTREPTAGTSHFRRNSHTLYHNTSYKNTQLDSPSASGIETFREKDEICSFSDQSQSEKNLINQQSRWQSSAAVLSSLPDTSDAHSSIDDTRNPVRRNSIGCNNATPASTQHNYSQHHYHREPSSRNNSATSNSSGIREKALKRLSLDVRYQKDGVETVTLGACSSKKQQLVSPDSGILIHHHTGEIDSDQVSFHVEPTSKNGIGLSHCGGKSHSQRSKDTTKETELLLSPVLPISPSPLHRNGKSSGNFSVQQTPGRRKGPKLSLPFVNVNDMTIIENKTYDLRDA